MILSFLEYAVVALFLVVTCSGPASALSTMPDKPQTASISLGAEFATGKYGTDTTIRSMYMPLIAAWSPNDRFDISIEVPFIYQSSSGVTTSLFNTNLSSTNVNSVAKGGPGGNSGAFGRTLTSGSSGSSSSSVSGLGDIIMRLGFIALPEGDKAPQLRPSLFVKFPTANKSDGLGTGEFDAGCGLEATKWFGDLHLVGEALYTWQGRTDGFNLKNYVSYTAGVGYQITKSLEPMLVIKGATAPSSYSGSLLETRARVVWTISNATALDLYGSKGIVDSSPDYGGGLSVIYSF